MTRRISPFVLAGVILLPLAAADWRADVAGFFSREKGADYRAALTYLESRFASLTEDDKPAASGLLAFLNERLRDKPGEYRWLCDYFERYGAIDMGFQFLPPSSRAEVYHYLRDWQLKYPWVMKIGIVSSSAVTLQSSIDPPSSLILGVEMANEVFYKLAADGDVVKGGMFRRGFNEIELDVRKVFRESGNYPYVLEFKAGDLLIRRTIILALRRETFGAVGRQPKAAETAEYAVKVYLGNRLLASNQKTVPISPPLDIPVPPPSGRYDPFGPGYQNEPRFPTSVPITAVPEAIKELVDAFKKRNDVKPVPPVDLRMDMQYLFSEKDPQAPQVEVRAHLWLDFREIKFLSYSAQK
jgi:hypothetical protein